MQTRRITMLTLVMAAIFLLGGVSLVAQNAPIAFEINNVESYVPGPPAITPWMFDLDSPQFLTSDGNPFTFEGNPFYGFGNYAYDSFYSTSALNPPWDDRFPYSSSCIAEDLAFVDGVDGFGIDFDAYTLTAFQHINTVNPGAAWNVAGQAGDIRTYTNGISNIYQDGNLVMRVVDCVLQVKVHYPNAAQIRETTGINAWVLDIGTGLGSEVTGWGTVDLVHTDPDWADMFADPNVGNRIDFTMSSVSNVIQYQYGYYSFDLEISPAPNALAQDHELIDGPGAFDFADMDLDFNFHTVDFGGPQDNLNDLQLFRIETSPEGIFPDWIQSLPAFYWEFGTTLDSFSTDVTFSLDDFGDSTFWQVLRRGDGEDSWQVWHDITILDANRIRANNVNAFSDWAVGSTEDNTLPVILSSFTALYTGDGDVKISWTTQSESQIAGYRIFKAQGTDLSSAMQISSLIQGTNSSQTQVYEFIDSDVLAGSSYNYWLQQADMNGENIYHGPISVYTNEPDEESSPHLELDTAIRRIFPNPARSASIDISLAKDANLEIVIYNLRGQRVKSLYNGHKSEGIHYLVWDGMNDDHQLCSHGVYIIVLMIDNKPVESSKFMLVR